MDIRFVIAIGLLVAVLVFAPGPFARSVVHGFGFGVGREASHALFSHGRW